MSYIKKPNVSAEAKIAIDAPISEVWNVLGNQYAEIDKWAAGVNYSKAVGTGKNLGEASCDGRDCEVNVPGFSKSQERIVEFDAKNYILKYQLVKGLPSFVKDTNNVFSLRQLEGLTVVSANTQLRATGIMGFLMKGIMKRNLTKVLRYTIEELKHYMETGKVHPRKKKAMEKQQ